MLMKCIGFLYSGRFSYCVKRVFSIYAKFPELRSDSLTKFYPLLRYSVYTKRSKRKSHEEGQESERECKKKDQDVNIETLKTTLKNNVYDRELQNYFLRKPNVAQIKDHIPEIFMKRPYKSSNPLHLVDEDVADQIAKIIKKDVVKEGCFVLEANPGLGLLSRKLIDIGVKQLYLFEPSSTCVDFLKELQAQYSDSIVLKKSDFFTIWKSAYIDIVQPGNRVKKLLSFLPTQDWSDEPILKIVGATHSERFVRHLILSIVFQNSFMEYCRPECYLALPPSLYNILKGGYTYSGHNTFSVLFHLFFDHEVLEELPREAFFPWLPKPKKSLSKKKLELMQLNQKYLYFVKIVPKKDLYEKVASPEMLPQLWFFVDQNLVSQLNRVIPKLESWIPNCGPRLIFDGYNVYTQFGDLSPQQILNLFHQFIKWPEFPDCPFIPSLEAKLGKMANSDDGNQENSADVADEIVDNTEDTVDESPDNCEYVADSDSEYMTDDNLDNGEDMADENLENSKVIREMRVQVKRKNWKKKLVL